MKKLLFLGWLFFFWPATVWAAGLEVVAPQGPIFSAQEIWFPGHSVGGQGEKWVELKNDENVSSGVVVQVGDNNFSTAQANGLAEKIYFSIYKIENGTSSCLYGCGANVHTLADLAQTGAELPANQFSLAPGGQGKLYFSATMDSLAGNEYQGKAATFTLLFGSLPVATPTPTPILTPTPTPTPIVTSTPTPTPATTATSSPTTTANGGGKAGTTTCSDTAPPAPRNLTAVPAGYGQVLLSWQSGGGSVDHYAIVYGLASHHYLYGNLDVGKAERYLVSGLALGKRYYFAVRAAHGCAWSGDSNEATVAAGGAAAGPAPNQPVPGFQVLGKKTPEGKISGGEKQEAGSTLGAKRKKYNLPWLKLSLGLGGTGLAFSLFWLWRRRR